jgi:hypothetical protein
MLCPNCGARPRWTSKVTRLNEVIEKSWWCTYCYAFIEATPDDQPAPHVVDHYVDQSSMRSH